MRKNKKYNYVFFFSEGPPNDKGLALGECKDKLIESAKHHVDNISYYTPKILEDMGYGEYVKNYENKGLCTKNPGMNHIGFEAWKPLILLLELEKMEDGDILIYKDCNFKKYGHFRISNFDNIKNIVNECITECKFDFFFPRQASSGYISRFYTKTNIIRELGDDHIFSYNFPVLWSGAGSFFKKTSITLEFLKEWETACLKEEWRNGDKYGELDEKFKWSTNAQSIMNIIIANWIRKRKYNIPLTYPEIVFPNAMMCKRFKCKHNTHLNYLVNNRKT